MKLKLAAAVFVAFTGTMNAQTLAPPTVPVEVHPRLTIPSDTGHYRGYYIGGGALNLHKAEPRYLDEGTWGWDYQGWLLPRRIVLGWCHGRRYQDGSGAYRTDSPIFLHPAPSK